MSKLKIIITRSLRGWKFCIKTLKGKTIAESKVYTEKSNAMHGAKVIAGCEGFKVEVEG